MATREQQFDRAMLHSALLSVLWCAMSENGKLKPGIGDKLLAIGINRDAFNRLFNNSQSQITVKRAAEIAGALGLHWKIELIDEDGKVYTPSGPR